MKLFAQGSSLDLSHPHVMGILNVTPDSFSDGGAHNSLVEAVKHANFEAMQGFHAGWRKSGIGGADGKHGLNEYLQTQVVYLQS